jgi:hypothetical protein
MPTLSEANDVEHAIAVKVRRSNPVGPRDAVFYSWRSGGHGRVDVTLYIGSGMQHIFPMYCGVIPEADAAVVMIGGCPQQDQEAQGLMT